MGLHYCSFELQIHALLPAAAKEHDLGETPTTEGYLMQFWKCFVSSAVLLGSAAISMATPGPRAGRPPEPPTTLRSLYSLSPPSELQGKKCALLLVDFQREFVDGRLPLPEVQAAIKHAVELANWARRAGILVVAVKNIVSRPGSPVFAESSASSAFVTELSPQPGDFVLTKAMAGAFSKTNLDLELKARGIDTLIVAGLMTHLAVLTTASDGMVLGYRVLVAADATATRTLPGAPGGAALDARTLQRAALASMADRAADVLTNRAIVGLPLAP